MPRISEETIENKLLSYTAVFNLMSYGAYDLTQNQIDSLRRKLEEHQRDINNCPELIYDFMHSMVNAMQGYVGVPTGINEKADAGIVARLQSANAVDLGTSIAIKANDYRACYDSINNDLQYLKVSKRDA